MKLNMQKFIVITFVVIVSIVSFSGVASGRLARPFSSAVEVLDRLDFVRDCMDDSDCVQGAVCFARRCEPDDVCLETDGGENIHVRGNVRGSWESFPGFFSSNTDSCRDENTLTEYSCSPNGPWTIVNDHHCQFGCFDGRCLKPGEELPQCVRLLPDHVVTDHDAINIVFIGKNQVNIDELLQTANDFIDYQGMGSSYIDDYGIEFPVYGFFGVEPFKSNKGKFDFWYVDEIYCPDKTCDPQTATDLVTICNLENKYTVEVVDFAGLHARSVGPGTWQHPSDGVITDHIAGMIEMGHVRVRRGHRSEHWAVKAFMHEIAHGIGYLMDVYRGGNWGYPNSATTLEDARAWWDDLIGDGCGEDGVVDCLEDCFELGQCEQGEYGTEVQYIVRHPENCFEEGLPVRGCGLSAARIHVSEEEFGGFEVWETKNISLRAMSRDDCLSGQDNCMYLDRSDESNEPTYMCYDKKLERLDECDRLADEDRYRDTGDFHQMVEGAPYMPHVSSIMSGGTMLYGLVNERQLCSKIAELTGSAVGSCHQFSAPLHSGQTHRPFVRDVTVRISVPPSLSSAASQTTSIP